jgi:hypothetical protein
MEREFKRTMRMPQARPTMSVPEAGEKYYGLSRNASYAAARRGDIPTINIGSRKFAVVAAIERRLAEAGGAASADSDAAR